MPKWNLLQYPAPQTSLVLHLCHGVYLQLQTSPLSQTSEEKGREKILTLTDTGPVWLVARAIRCVDPGNGTKTL